MRRTAAILAALVTAPPASAADVALLLSQDLAEAYAAIGDPWFLQAAYGAHDNGRSTAEYGALELGGRHRAGPWSVSATAGALTPADHFRAGGDELLATYTAALGYHLTDRWSLRLQWRHIDGGLWVDDGCRDVDDGYHEIDLTTGERYCYRDWQQWTDWVSVGVGLAF